jgi:meso-butanediol dehydrogenase/(S,S)-butanediol dehydrogenase/diacetyl reductase
MKLENKTAIVTGAGRGIGKGISMCLAEEGASIVLADIDLESAEQTAAEIEAMGRRSLVVRTDVTHRDEVQAMVARTLDAFGRIDIVVNNAGVVGQRRGLPLSNLQEEDWDVCYGVNLKGIFIICKEIVPHFMEQRAGKIINIASVAGRQGEEALPHYSASKAGVISFTQALAKELGPHNINVNCICPGLLWTPMWRQLEGMFTGDTSPEAVERRQVFEAVIRQLTPLKREQMPEDIGKLAAFLASEDARNITGQSINVDGGARLN